MSVWLILDTILFKPIQTVFEMIYGIAYRLIDSSILSIVILIMVLNLCFFPLYKRADAVRNEACDKKTKIQKGIILLFFQTSFFLASYRFLLSLQQMEEGVVSGLGKPALFLTALVCFSSFGFVICRLFNYIFLLVRLILEKLKKKDEPKIKHCLKKTDSGERADKKLFFSGAVFLTVLLGLWIPSTVINASPQEFVDVLYFYHPLWFLVSSFEMAVGFCVVWPGIYYWLSGPSLRLSFDKGVWIVCGIAVTDYIFFGKKLGIMTSELKYENGVAFTAAEQFVNIIAVLMVIFGFCLIYRFRRKWIADILAVGALALCGMVAVNVVNISRSVSDVTKRTIDEKREEVPCFTLSRTGKNVIVLMLDRAMGEYIPYMFNEKPQLEEQFSGFVYYPNVVSFGGYTIFGAPALFGGYEYTPVEMNQRSEEALASKHNEALKVMPLIFLENEYEVTVCDPPYANYQWIPDLSIYDEYTQIQSYITDGYFSDEAMREQWVCDNRRNFFLYGFFKASPLCIREAVYDDGQYNAARGANRVYARQITDGLFNADGIKVDFMDNYNVLVHFSDMTYITDEPENTFLMMDNDTTHEPMMLQEPDYVPIWHVDNTEYSDSYQERFSLDGHVLKMETEQQVKHYHANMAVMLQLGKWFDYMRENDVYDNTRIILVSDHGRDLYHMDEMVLEDGTDTSLFYPLLMIKDFGSEEFVVSEEFMTIADVPTMATSDIIESPVNPFTGQQIDADEKTAHRQYIIYSEQCNVEFNNGNTFLPGKWYSVEDDMRNPDNWRLEAEDAVLPFADE